MVDAELAQQGRLQVVHTHRILGDAVAKVVRFAVYKAPFEAAARNPKAEAGTQVVSAMPIGLGNVALAERRAAELAAPDDQRVVEHPALLQVLDQRGGRPSVSWHLLLELGEEVAVLVPAGVHQLHEPDAPFEQPPGDQAVVRERALASRLGAVLSSSGRLLERSTRSGTLDCIRKAISYWAMRVSISGIAVVGQVRLRSARHVVEQARRSCAAHARRVGQIGHRVARVAEADALELAGQEAAAPVVVEEQLAAGLALVGEVITTKVGRLSVSLPRPYDSQAPMLGRPGVWPRS